MMAMRDWQGAWRLTVRLNEWRKRLQWSDALEFRLSTLTRPHAWHAMQASASYPCLMMPPTGRCRLTQPQLCIQATVKATLKIRAAQVAAEVAVVAVTTAAVTMKRVRQLVMICWTDCLPAGAAHKRAARVDITAVQQLAAAPPGVLAQHAAAVQQVAQVVCLQPRWSSSSLKSWCG